MGAHSDNQLFTEMEAMEAGAKLEARASRDSAGFDAGVEACKRAIVREFGAESGFTGRLLSLMDTVKQENGDSLTVVMTIPNPPPPLSKGVDNG